jgi:phosphate transport system protein
MGQREATDMLKELMALWSAENPLTAAYGEADKMLDISKVLFDKAVAFTLDGVVPDIDLHATDKQVNKLHQSIRKRLLEHLSVNPKQDMVASLMLLSVVDDLERLGDYCKNIEELPNLADISDLDSCDCGKLMRDAAAKVSAAFDLSRKAFTKADPVLARQVMSGHRLIKELCDKQTTAVFADESLPRNCALISVLYMRYMKRISAHLKNICSGVANPFDKIGYTKTGQEDE